MSDKSKKVHIPKELTQFGYETKEQVLEVSRKKKSMYIGIPKEISPSENRVPLVPASVATLVANGHRVVIESGAGLRANYTDQSYSEVGADIAFSQAQVYKSDVIIKVAPPTLDEIDLFHSDQILIAPLQLPLISKEYFQKLNKKRVIAIAMEYIKDDNNTYPVVRIMSELAGRSAMMIAAGLMAKSNGGKGVLLGGVAGVPSAKVVILGAGVVAEYAAKVALGLGADLRIFDNNIYKLMRIQNLLGVQLNTSSFNPYQLEKELLTADVAVGALHSKSGRTPMLVSEDIVSKMKAKSVIIDVSIDQGGCFETSRPTTLDKPTFVKHDVIHFCVPNIASNVPRTSSIAISNILMPILLKAADIGSMEYLIYQDRGLMHGVYTYKGCLTNSHIGQRFGLKHTDLHLLITSAL